MGKKGSWFSAIKKAFTHSSKEKPSYGFDKKSSKEKKTGRGLLRHGESKSFIPRSREPSSIEKILGEADQLLLRPPTLSHEPKTSPPRLWKPASPRAASPEATSPRVSSARLTSPKAPLPRFLSPRPALATTSTHPEASSKNEWKRPEPTQNRKEIRYVQRPEPTLRNQHRSATVIQATYRGYLARRNFRALRGLMRLQGVVRGQNAKRQTINAMKQMQLLVRVQTQIQSRRIQMLENQALAHRNDKEAESTLSKTTSNQLPEGGNNDDWDDSLITKEEREARLRKKVEAVVKRERAMAYAYSHQLWKANPKSAESPVDIRSNGYPWWWNWLERQLPPATTTQTGASTTKNVPIITPPRPVSEYKASPQLNYRHSNFASNDQKELTRAKRPSNTPSPAPTIKNSKPRGNPAYDFPMKDDDSLTSCPAFSVPSYMSPTVSAKAKVRPNSNPKERLPGTPANDSKRRFSFSLTTNIGSFKWSKGPSKESASHKPLHKHITPHSIGDLSIDSTVSMPAMGGRKPFNRFV